MKKANFDVYIHRLYIAIPIFVGAAVLYLLFTYPFDYICLLVSLLIEICLSLIISKMLLWKICIRNDRIIIKDFLKNNNEYSVKEIDFVKVKSFILPGKVDEIGMWYDSAEICKIYYVYIKAKKIFKFTNHLSNSDMLLDYLEKKHIEFTK